MQTREHSFGAGRTSHHGCQPQSNRFASCFLPFWEFGLVAFSSRHTRTSAHLCSTAGGETLEGRRPEAQPGPCFRPFGQEPLCRVTGRFSQQRVGIMAAALNPLSILEAATSGWYSRGSSCPSGNSAPVLCVPPPATPRDAAEPCETSIFRRFARLRTPHSYFGVKGFQRSAARSIGLSAPPPLTPSGAESCATTSYSAETGREDLPGTGVKPFPAVHVTIKRRRHRSGHLCAVTSEQEEDPSGFHFQTPAHAYFARRETAAPTLS